MADDTLIFDTRLDTSGLSTGLGKIGSVAGTAFKGVAVAVGAATTAVGALTKSALEGYASYEQLTGGVETLFKDSADTVMKYAENAYKTAGMSSNEYMETVTSFSASLLQSLGGDTEKAANTADMAVTDMSDNANKMGTSMEAIQNAYNGFAKGNYTMLDNLKLGYGGTKEEMQRLLEDAEKLSGVEYDISSFADIADAIHVVQTEMGITGTTAKEASTTIEGSVNSMKSAWANLVVGIADDNADLDSLINQFIESAVTAGGNIIPRIEQILTGVGTLIETMVPKIMETLPSLINNVLPQMLESGVSVVNSLIQGIIENLPSLLDIALDLVNQLVEVIIQNLPTLIEAGLQIIVQLALGIAEALPELIPTIVDTLLMIVDTLIDNIDMLVDAAIAIVVALTEGLINALPKLIEKIPEIIIKLVNAIVKNAPKLMSASLQLITTLAGALITYLPQLLAKVPEIVVSLVNGFIQLHTKFTEIGKKFIETITEAIASAWTSLVGRVSTWVGNLKSKFIEFVGRLTEVGKKYVDTIKDGITNTWSILTGKVSEWVNKLKEKFTSSVQKFTSIGKNIVDGIWNGLKEKWDWLTSKVSDLASGLFKAAKKTLGIASPSKKFKYLGEMCVAGMDEPIEDYNPYDTMEKSFKANAGSLQASYSSGTNNGGITIDYAGIGDQVKNAISGMAVTIDGRTAGALLAEPVNNALGTISGRRY